MTIACAELMSRLGWHCRPLGDANYISTPVQLGCGKPLDFYLQARGDRIHVTDDGMTLFALRAMGYPLDDRRTWRPLAAAIEPFGLTLDEQGEIVADFDARELPLWGHRLLAGFAAIAAWDSERRAERDDDLSLSREIERIIRDRDPAATLIADPRIRLPGGIDVGFALRWNGVYVDPLAPTANAVSARVRKALLVARDLNLTQDILFVVDDRTDAVAADRELGVIAQVARAVRFTDFRARPATHH